LCRPPRPVGRRPRRHLQGRGHRPPRRPPGLRPRRHPPPPKIPPPLIQAVLAVTRVAQLTSFSVVASCGLLPRTTRPGPRARTAYPAVAKYTVSYVSGPTQAECHPELAPCGGAAGALERTDPSLRMTIVTAGRRLTAAELAKDPRPKRSTR